MSKLDKDEREEKAVKTKSMPEKKLGRSTGSLKPGFKKDLKGEAKGKKEKKEDSADRRSVDGKTRSFKGNEEKPKTSEKKKPPELTDLGRNELDPWDINLEVPVTRDSYIDHQESEEVEDIQDDGRKSPSNPALKGRRVVKIKGGKKKNKLDFADS